MAASKKAARKPDTKQRRGVEIRPAELAASVPPAPLGERQKLERELVDVEALMIELCGQRSSGHGHGHGRGHVRNEGISQIRRSKPGVP
jgi:hypothetical protein